MPKTDPVLARHNLSLELNARLHRAYMVAVSMMILFALLAPALVFSMLVIALVYMQRKSEERRFAEAKRSETEMPVITRGASRGAADAESGVRRRSPMRDMELDERQTAAVAASQLRQCAIPFAGD